MSQSFEPWAITGNIARFKALLDTEVDLGKRKTLEGLLAEETVKLEPRDRISPPHNGTKRPQP